MVHTEGVQGYRVEPGETPGLCRQAGRGRGRAETHPKGNTYHKQQPNWEFTSLGGACQAGDLVGISSGTELSTEDFPRPESWRVLPAGTCSQTTGSTLSLIKPLHTGVDLGLTSAGMSEGQVQPGGCPPNPHQGMG